MAEDQPPQPGQVQRSHTAETGRPSGQGDMQEGEMQSGLAQTGGHRRKADLGAAEDPADTGGSRQRYTTET